MPLTPIHKYLGEHVKVIFDRPLGTKHPKHDFIYEVNYGYIPNTVSSDGKEVDVYYLGVDTPLQEAEGKCIAVIHRENDVEDKLIVVPEGVTFTDQEIMEKVHFQEKWFESVVISLSGLGRKGVIFILTRDNKFLMQQRDGNSKAFKFRWCFPGGGMDDGEDYAQTLEREVKEEYEVDIKAENCTLLMERSIGRINHVYICPVDDSQEPVLKEGADMRWMTMGEIKTLNIGFYQHDIVEVLEKYL